MPLCRWCLGELPPAAATGRPRSTCSDRCRRSLARHQGRSRTPVPPEGLTGPEVATADELPTWRDSAERIDSAGPGSTWRMPHRIGQIGTPCYCSDRDRTCWLHVALALFPSGIVPPVSVPTRTDQDLPVPPEHFPPEWLPERRARWTSGDLLDPDPLTASAVVAELLFSAGATPGPAMRVHPPGRSEELEIELSVTDAKARKIPLTDCPLPVEWFAKMFHPHCCRCGGKAPCSSNDLWILRSIVPGVESDAAGHPLHWVVLLQRRREQEQIQVLWGHRAADCRWRLLGGRDFNGESLQVWQLRKRRVVPG